MRRHRDIVEIEGLHADAAAARGGRPGREPDIEAEIESGGRSTARRPFLMIWFRCCATYARLPKAPDGRSYAGHCPKCRARLEVPVGEGGTNRRMFEAS